MVGQPSDRWNIGKILRNGLQKEESDITVDDETGMQKAKWSPDTPVHAVMRGIDSLADDRKRDGSRLHHETIFTVINILSEMSGNAAPPLRVDYLLGLWFYTPAQR